MHGGQLHLMDNAFSFAKTNSICTKESYPYTATDGTCNLSGCQVGIPQGGVVDYTDVSHDSEQAMMSAVTQQPVSIDIETDQYSVQLYFSEMFIASCGSHLDHGVSALVTNVRLAQTTERWRIRGEVRRVSCGTGGGRRTELR